MRVARLELLSERHEGTLIKHDSDIRQLQDFRSEMVGAAREGAKDAALRLGTVGLILTLANIVVTHWG